MFVIIADGAMAIIREYVVFKEKKFENA